jgi:hypothetical protein
MRARRLARPRTKSAESCVPFCDASGSGPVGRRAPAAGERARRRAGAQKLKIVHWHFGAERVVCVAAKTGGAQS